MMILALEEAIKAFDAHEVPIGCIITHNGKIVSKGHNKTNETKNPLAHAELVALKEILHLNINLNELMFYVTLEPCIMCEGILRRIGSKVFYGSKNTIFGSESIMNVNNVNMEYVECKESVRILQMFFERENVFAPPEKRKTKTHS